MLFSRSYFFITVSATVIIFEDLFVQATSFFSYTKLYHWSPQMFVDTGTFIDGLLSIGSYIILINWAPPVGVVVTFATIMLRNQEGKEESGEERR